MRNAMPPDADNGDAADDWLEALAGRPRASADPTVNAEAVLLREASRRWPVSAPPTNADESRAQLAALLAAARRDPRLAARRGCAACEAVRRWLSPPRLAGVAALAAVALLVAVVAPWQAFGPGGFGANSPDDTLRGSATEGVQHLRAADAGALRDRIADDLARAGVPVTRYERQGRFGLDAELPVPPPDELLHLLRSRGLAAPPSGGLAVEIESAP